MRQDPFTLGVASGDPEPDSVVLWTRLTGVPELPLSVPWQLSADPAGARVLREGVADALPEWGHSVHVEVEDLEPSTEYYFRFRHGRHLSLTGRTRTTPHPVALEPLRLAVTSGDALPSAADLVLCLGEHRPSGSAREQRERAMARLTPAAQLARASAPQVSTWGPGELSGEWVAACRAYYEHQPLRAASRPDGGRMPIYRSLRWGRLLALRLVDTQQYRQTGSLLGTGQERWLAGELGRRRPLWDVVAGHGSVAELTGERLGALWRRARVESPLVLRGGPGPAGTRQLAGAPELAAGVAGSLLCEIDERLWRARFPGPGGPGNLAFPRQCEATALSEGSPSSA
ncbi:MULTISPECIES: PhoD-like phosphatase N-terminal domain-containing protein [unclassified Crossiella]|uniref:alkaline phosphatase D family protein n=1 Tax=unclassified Crossiella TaxID=2620835 RepID=UPI001FFFD5CF|nr:MULTISPECIES: PhoD-like phosphatase N-terminal domain-containing protein [unclassified Crossiella]MCK2236332.1 PhoD-like phosphatase N-terminal domain-containing protein [Crossiella sp. S99.2]MCK2249999.1 PhoD-like phosphatase N-terminal domain-containing protein [Crossiella sp. S99.1]